MILVALIEAFLAYPVTQLDGAESLIVVIFMTSFPFFVAALFFVVLWHKPLHLYNPQDIPRGLQDQLKDNVVKAGALELRLKDVQTEVRGVRRKNGPFVAAVLPSPEVLGLADEADRMVQSDLGALEAEFRERISADTAADESAVQQAKVEVSRNREEKKRRLAKRILGEMSTFQTWLERQGFSPPDLPQIVIEPSDLLNAYYSPTEDTSYFGASIAEDPDVIAHTYFHSVLQSFSSLGKTEGEVAVLVEGLCDYYACSYNDDPLLGEVFANAQGLGPGWLRNLEQVVRLNDAAPDLFSRSVAWSGACWTLRERYGQERIDPAIRATLEKLPADPNLGQAATILHGELVAVAGDGEKDSIKAVFEQRGLIVSA